jgi:SET domain-containing protein
MSSVDHARATAAERQPDMVEVRRSSVHGRGVFASRRIRKGTRIIEYLGERVSHQEADRRYEHKGADDNHTFLFIVDGRTVVDAGINGNEARFINHSCDPNCESVIERGRIFIEAVRTIQPGEELNYDYRIARDRTDPPDIDAIFACHCGAEHCRGSMLWPRQRVERRRADKGRARRRRHSGGETAMRRRSAR